MNILAATFLSVALILAVVLGPQTRPWTWGPSLIFLGLAVLCAVPSFIRHKARAGSGFLILGAVAAGWFAWRAAVSPVAELRMADLLLLCGVVGSFVAMAPVSGDRRAEGIFLWSLAALLVANVVVIFLQVADPTFHPVFASKPVTLPSGFYTHYNECANFLVGAGFILGGASLFGSYSRATRIVWGLVAAGGLLAVYYTRSRGGILAVGGASVVFAIVALLTAKRRNSRYLSLCVIMVPFLLLVAIGWIFKGWGDAQNFRFQTDETTVTAAATVMENSVRLHFIDIALSCIQLHPWGGGGSRSFSWECNQFWILSDHGTGAARVEYVHNELLQSATDYGIVGAILLVALLSWASLKVIIRSCSNWGSPGFSVNDALQAGGIAGLAGMFIQSSFSFVFHLFPGVILLGICLGRMVFQYEREESRKHPRAEACILTAAGVATALVALWMGVTGTRLLVILWDSYFRVPAETSHDAKAAALTRATAIWPQASLYGERSFALQRSAQEAGLPASANPFVFEAISGYQEAIRLHPYDANLRTNLAALLESVGKDEEAEQEYRQALLLQGGMESAYKAHLGYSGYLVRRGMRELASNRMDEASLSFGEALQQLERSEEKSPPWIRDQPAVYEQIASLYIGVGITNEAAGDYTDALAYYDRVAEALGKSEGHFRAGLLLGKMAETAWKERQPSKALTLFQKARQRLEAANNLPPTQRNMRDEHLSFVSTRIQYLLDARITPDE